MAGRTEYEAVQNFLNPFQLAISCAVDAVLNNFGGYYVRPDPHVVVLGRNQPQRLRDVPFLIRVIHYYRIVETDDHERGPWRTATAGYHYSLEDLEEREVLAYHWHPHQAPAFPHLHLGPVTGAVLPQMQTAHLPTGRISIERFLRLCLNDFKARALRDDYEGVLESTETAFLRWRTQDTV